MFALLGPETFIVALTLLLSLLFPNAGRRWFRRLELVLAQVAQRRRLSILLCGSLALAVRATLLVWVPFPQPFVHDEFSYLLAADTFAHARAINAPHPMWIHFESFHIFFQPTYGSMYPPLQGLVLAAGQTLAGHPFWGVMFSVAAMCAAICWMLQAWLPAPWALLGGTLPILRFGVFSYWDNSYWGGAVAATGGALVLGAWPRILRHWRARDAASMAVGIAILANSRPYEGLVLCLAVAAAMTLAMLRRPRPAAPMVLLRAGLPLLLILLPVALGMGYYFWRVTGNPFHMPYQVDRAQYAVAHYFYWQQPSPPPVYHHTVLRTYYCNLELSEYLNAHSVRGFFQATAIKIGRTWTFFIGPLLTIPLVLLPWVVQDSRIKPLIMVGGIGFLGTLLVTIFFAHYLAPITGVLVAVIVQGMRHLRTVARGKKAPGLFLCRAIVIACVLMGPFEAEILATKPKPGTWPGMGPERIQVLQILGHLPEPQLVFVRYDQQHDVRAEWVYNEADIDNSKVIWARDMGFAQNQELIRYYPTRRFWLLEPDSPAPILSPYRATGDIDSEATSVAPRNLSPVSTETRQP